MATFGGNSLHKTAKAKDWVAFRTSARRNPDQLIQRDEALRSPLHSAISHGAPVEVIVQVLQIDGRLARLKDRDNNTLLHAAFEYGVGKEAALALLRAQPQLIHVKNGNDQTPLELLKGAKAAAFGLKLGLTWVYFKDQYEEVCTVVEQPSRWQEGYTPDPSELPPSMKVEAYVGVPVELQLNEMIGAEYMFSCTAD